MIINKGKNYNIKVNNKNKVNNEVIIIKVKNKGKL